MRFLRHTLLALAVALLAVPAQAQLVAETFDYPTGDPLTSHGYTAHSGAGLSPVVVTNVNLTFPGYPTNGGFATQSVSGSGSREDVHRTFPAVGAGSSVYAAMLVRVDAATTTGEYPFHLGANPLGFNFRARMMVRTTAGGAVEFGISKVGGATTAVWAPTTYAIGETVLAVVRYDIGPGAADDVASLYVFGAADDYSTQPGAPDATDSAGTDTISSLASFAFRQHSQAHTVTFDGVRVGTSWAHVLTEASGFTFVTPTGTSSYTAGTWLKPIWASTPAGAGGDVTVTLRQGGTDLAVLYQGPNMVQPYFGAGRYLLPQTLAGGADFTVYVELDSNPAVNAESDAFTVVPAPVLVFSPAPGGPYTAGEPQTVQFATSGVPTPQRANAFLRRIGEAGSVMLGSETSSDGTLDVTIPSDATAGDGYFVLLRVKAGGDTYRGRSGLFAIAGPANGTAPQPTHFVVGAPLTEREAWLEVRTDLRDGAEVGVFAGDVLVGAALVRDGVAAVAVRGGDLEDGEALSLRAFDGVETTLAAMAVTDVEGDAAALVFADLAELTVETARGATAADPAVTLRVAPNPTAGTAVVRVSAPAEVSVYDVLGRRVADLGTVETEARWDASGASPGVYVVRATSASGVESVRVTVSR